MPKKFRKMYFICRDNKVIEDNIAMVNAYKDRKYAESVCDSWNKMAQSDSEKWYNNNQSIPKYTVHAFYLIHEFLF